jgi:hypothetical protein
MRVGQGRPFDPHYPFRHAERRWCARFSVYSLAWLRPLRNSDSALKPCQVATRSRTQQSSLNLSENPDTLALDRAQSAHSAPSCEASPLASRFSVDQTTSLQNRRNSQLTHGRRLAGAGGIRSPLTAARMASSAWRTFWRSAGVIEIISAVRSGML